MTPSSVTTCARPALIASAAPNTRRAQHRPAPRTALLVQVQNKPQAEVADRRQVFRSLSAGLAGLCVLQDASTALALPGFQKDLKPARLKKIPEEAYTTLPSGIKYYDVKVGEGLLAKEGERVVVHFDCKWRGITFMTSRQGMGVTGGTPMGFDVGAKGAGGTLDGLDLGVRGMRVGGQRKLKVPPEYGYGNRQMGEVPPGSTLDIDVELLSIKTSPLGYQVKLIEG